MDPDLAEELLGSVMDWRAEQIGKNYRDLRALGNFGYDDYMQFGPGRRFMESLANWLHQFDKEHRQAAYDFVLKRLLFITRTQMQQIVSVTYDHRVVPMLVEQVAEESGGKFLPWQIRRIRNSGEFKELHDRCLFLGLSDGSHMDEFRRSNERIDHEQVSRTHEISQERASSLQKKLADRLGSNTDAKPLFRNVFLLDDFSASGSSYWRDEQGPKGKIASFYRSITNADDPLGSLVDIEDLRVCVILYVATDTAKRALETCKTTVDPIRLKVVPIHLLPSEIRFDEKKDKNFAPLVHDPKFDSDDLMDRHMEKGNTTNPPLGFGNCALPLVLYHNTPNNSLLILHNTSEKYYRGLFPRITRHR